MSFRTRDALKVSALIGLFALVGCGGDKSSVDATGGTGTGGAGGSGAGGTGGAPLPPQPCSHTAPPTATISNFVPWGSDGKWGATGELTGGQALYQDTSGSTGFTVTVDADAGDPALHLTGTVVNGGYTGFVMWFGPCVDASAYQGIKFDISGTLGGATMSFQVQMNDDYPTDVTNKKGACAGGSWTETTCWNNRAAVTVDTDAGPVTTPITLSYAWADLVDGYPTTPIDPSQLLGIQWEANCSATAGCAVDLTIDNVVFY